MLGLWVLETQTLSVYQVSVSPSENRPTGVRDTFGKIGYQCSGWRFSPYEVFIKLEILSGHTEQRAPGCRLAFLPPLSHSPNHC